MNKQQKSSYNIRDINQAIKELANNDLITPTGDKISIPDKRKLAIILSGGGASGAFEAGVIEEALKSIDKHNTQNPNNKIKIEAILGTSTGSLNSYGMFLDQLRKNNKFNLPKWIETRKETSLNGKLWGYIASKKYPAKFIIDKPWLLKILQCYSPIKKWLAIGIIFITTFILPFFATIFANKIIPFNTTLASPGWNMLGQFGTIISGLLLWFLILKQLKNKITTTAYPLTTFLTFATIGTFFITIIRNLGNILLPITKTMHLYTNGFFLLAAITIIIQLTIMLNKQSIFDNSRLRSLLTALSNTQSSKEEIGIAICKTKAKKESQTISKNIIDLYYKNNSNLAEIFFTASDITGGKQGLFSLAKNKTIGKLDSKNRWLPIGFSKNNKGGYCQSKLLFDGILASTAIPATYPAEIINFQYNKKEHQHIFIDGGLLDFVPYHAAIDLGCTHILSIETDSMLNDKINIYHNKKSVSMIENLYKTIYTGIDAEAIEEAKRVSETNQKVLKGLSTKKLVKLIRITPAENERMINADEFNGRYIKGKQVNTLKDWIKYAETVNPKAGKLPKSIWYKNNNDEWTENKNIQGPIIWNASFFATPKG